MLFIQINNNNKLVLEIQTFYSQENTLRKIPWSQKHTQRDLNVLNN